MARPGDDLTPEQKKKLILEGLEEVTGRDIVDNVLFNEKRPLKIYWGTATTGRPHCAYFVAMVHIARFLRAGCHVKVLLADVHGFLDNLKAPIELVEHRAKYYEFVIKALLKAIGVSIDQLEFVLGSSYQLTKEYQMDNLRLCTLTTLHAAQRAGAEVVKQVDNIENATLSGFIYPLMQCLDEQYLDVDAQFGGTDQRKIFMLSGEVLPKIGYKQRAHFMNPMVPGLAGGKMSASDPNSKIDVLDGPKVVEKKIKSAFAVPKEVEGNGLLAFVERVLMPVGDIRHGSSKFVVDRREGEPLVYTDFDKIKEDYAADIVNPQNLKAAVAKALNELLEPVQAEYNASKEWQELTDKAYPPPAQTEADRIKAAKKAAKQNKDKGSRAPGKAQPDGSLNGPADAQTNVSTSADAAIENLESAAKKLGV